jgi:hypothetical protein
MYICQMLLSPTSWAQITYQSFFHITDLITTTDISAPLENYTDCERFRILASALIRPRNQIDNFWNQTISYRA